MDAYQLGRKIVAELTGLDEDAFMRAPEINDTLFRREVFDLFGKVTSRLLHLFKLPTHKFDIAQVQVVAGRGEDSQTDRKYILERLRFFLDTAKSNGPSPMQMVIGPSSLPTNQV